MYNQKKILALIPARGGSKGIKGKNIIDLAGKPLISYSIIAAKRSKYIDSVVVSTDNEDIARTALEYGASVPFMRPSELASDTSKTIDSVIHAINELEKQGHVYDTLVLLQATQPLRDEIDIDSAIEEFFDRGEESLVSVSPVDDNPILIRTVNKDGSLCNLLNVSSTCRRQDMPAYYKVNGCIYINRISEINEASSFNDNKIPYIMPAEKSVDIDELKDLVVAEYYLKKKE